MPLLALLNIEFIMHIYINLASCKMKIKIHCTAVVLMNFDSM
jgi:hypothetical protein